jgi:hypothetical protein
VEKRIESGSKPLDKFDKKLIAEKKSLKCIIGNVNFALNIINTIAKSKVQDNVINCYTSRLESFFHFATEWCENAAKKWSSALDSNKVDTILVLVNDITENEKLFNDKLFINTFDL